MLYISHLPEVYIFLISKAPEFSEPLTPEDSNQFISIEAGVPFNDDDSQDVKLYDFGSKGFGADQKNIIRVIDARDHVVTEDISRKIYEGNLESEMSGASSTNFNFVTIIDNHPAIRQ